MLNKFVGMGRFVKDPELRTTQSGVSVATFTIAVDRDFQQGGNRQTDFIACVAWRNTAEFVSRHFHKGSMAVVAGSLQSRQWEDKDGNRKTSWEIQADQVWFGEPKRDASGFTEEPDDDDDVPF